MRARIWKDRETGAWCYDVRSEGLRSTGEREKWEQALAEVLDELASRRAART